MGFLSKIGPFELIVILVVVLLIFGPNKLPELGKSVAKTINEFKKSINSDDKKEDNAVETKPTEDRNETKGDANEEKGE